MTGVRGSASPEISEDGVAPPEVTEPAEVTVGRAQLTPVADRDRGQVGIRGQVAGSAGGTEKVAEYRPMFGRRSKRHDGSKGEPSLDDLQRLLG